MITVIGLSGSTRRESFNSALLRAAAAAMPAGAELRIESIGAIPLYNGDEEAAHGIPESVARLKDAIAAAAGLLLVTPEYNNSIPGVAKNAIDWLSRPPADIRRLRREARSHRRRFARRVRHHPLAECLAARVQDARRGPVVRGPPARLARRRRVRRQRRDHRRRDAGQRAQIRCRLRRLHWRGA